MVHKLLTPGSEPAFNQRMNAPTHNQWTLEKRALDKLTGPFLARIADRLEVPWRRSGTVSELRSVLGQSPSVTFDGILETTTKPGLRRLCEEFELSRTGTVAVLKERLRLVAAEWDGAACQDLDDEDFLVPKLASAAGRRHDPLPSNRPERRRYQQEAVQALLENLDVRQPILLHIASGGGKTWIANDVVARWSREHEQRTVLWVTKDWWLLRQAADDLKRRYATQELRLGRVGGARGPLRALDELSRDADVAYTTLTTLTSQITRGRLTRLKASLLIWDECHWGENAASGQQLLAWCRRRRIPVLGISSTPHPPEQSCFRVVYRKTFPALVKAGYLARPIPLAPIETGIRWDPHRLGDGDFQEKSLLELATNAARNRLIVEHYAQHRQQYGPTILYACSIDHADRLARLFERREGVAARPVHSGQPESVNSLYVDQFNCGEVEVLVNVALTNPVFEVPEAKTVFLCRPTLSDVLFTQMVGRAARRTSTKSEFYIVEFTDNLERHGELLNTTQTSFRGAIRCRLNRGKNRDFKGESHRRPREIGVTHHQFDPRGAAALIPADAELPEAIRGLWYRAGQTFGLELELTADDFVPNAPRGKLWHHRAEGLLDGLRSALGDASVARQPYPEYHHPDRNDETWNVEWDHSCGWEVTSRILRDREGFEEVVSACEALQAAAAEVGLRITHRTGLHVHIGWLGHTVREVRCALELARLFEPALATLVSPSRLVKFDGEWYDLETPNEFCKPLATAFPYKALKRVTTLEKLWSLSERKTAKDITLNIRPIDDLHTVEVRLHNGTLDASKILPWVSLWQQILWCAGSPRIIPAVEDRAVLRPDGDILALAHQFLPAGRQLHFLERLERRRRQVSRLWLQHPERSEWVAFSESWTPPSVLCERSHVQYPTSSPIDHSRPHTMDRISGPFGSSSP
jgi:superfamily II DNA or RNA helicase